MNRGAVQPLITQTDLKNYPIVIPIDKVLQIFNDVIDPMLTKLKDNILQIKTLSNNKDVLLPKLMSGEVRVSEIIEKLS